MKSFYRDPQVEEGVRNVILQNRCGNRLTLLIHDDRTDLEVVYRPNAFRRKEYRARNFSNRDVFTTAFGRIWLPEIVAGELTEVGYDPFVTRLSVQSPTGAANNLTFVNVADENAFVLAADRPMLIALLPHERFEASDGLLVEHFADRGEQIVSFVLFEGFETDRYRVLDDGTHVLQVFENEPVIVGAEENDYQVGRALDRLGAMDLDELIASTERAIAPPVARGRAVTNDADLQRVLDVNRRAVWSGLDAGGACFGALNRIYHLIWTRDGSMAASTLARAGWPDLAEIWTPFLLANPSRRLDERGRRVEEFLQIVGSRWTKTEDDGIYYAVLSLYSLYQASAAADALIEGGALEQLAGILAHTLASRWDAERRLFGSDTLGEDVLGESPYWGYDLVNGKRDASVHKGNAEKVKGIRYCYSLYQNVNLYNCLRMMQVLLDATGGDPARRDELGQRADELAESLAEQFVNEQGHYRAMLVVFDDDSTEWRNFAPVSDWWEYAWAVSAGPFLLDPARCVASARMAVDTWPTLRTYGYCPWNFLTRLLKDVGAIDTGEYRELMDQQIREALMETRRFAMPGAVTEYQSNVEGWRALPFGIGSLVLSVGSLLVQPLAQGLAVRAGTLVDRVERFRRRGASVDVRAEGEGEAVVEVRVNGQALTGTLQLPESLLRRGRNEIVVVRGTVFDGFRLHGSDAELLDAREVHGRLRYHLHSAVPVSAVFENLHDVGRLSARDAEGRRLRIESRTLGNTGKTEILLDGGGDIFLTCG